LFHSSEKAADKGLTYVVIDGTVDHGYHHYLLDEATGDPMSGGIIEAQTVERALDCKHVLKFDV
jgi:hypothetical protein